MHPQLLFSLILLLTFLTTGTAQTVTYIWDLHELDSLRQQPSSRAFRSYVQKADKTITSGVVAITDKATSRSGDKHNYESLSIYWWPDPAKPDGPYVARDGEFNPEYELYDYPRLLQLVNNLSTTSKAFYLTQQAKYYDYICRQLDTWFIDAATRMSPHFEYSQFIPGRNEGRGNPQGMIDAYNFNSVLECIRLTDNVRPLGKKRMKALRQWFKDFANWMENSNYGQTASQFKNSQAVAYDVTLYNIFIFTGNKAERRKLRQEFPSKRVATQIESDGSMPQELKRTKAFSYSISCLHHFIDFLALVKADSQAMDSVSIQKISSCIDFLSHFVGHRELFTYPELGNWNEQERLLKIYASRFKTLSEPPLTHSR